MRSIQVKSIYFFLLFVGNLYLYVLQCFLCYEVNTSITGKRVCHVLDRLIWLKGKPEMITVDSGPEFIGKALDAWAYRHWVKLIFNRPSKLVDNPYIESLNGRLRDECLNMHWFMNLFHAREVIEREA